MFSVLLFGLLPGAAGASNHSLQVRWEASSGSLPNELQLPFSLIDSADPEEPSLSGEVLTLSTSDNSERMFYRQLGSAVMIPDTLVIETRLRYVSGSSITPVRLPVAISFSTAPTVGNGLFIGQDQIFLLVSDAVAGTSAFVDTDGSFHTYRIEVIGSAIKVYHDDVQVLTGSTFSNFSTNGDSPRVSFGNLSIHSQGVSEWLWFEHNAGPPVVDAEWSSAFAIQANGGALHPALLVGMQPISGATSTSTPNAETIVLTYSGLALNEEIQIDVASFGLPFYPPDPIRVINAGRVEVDFMDNGTMFTLAIDLASSTGELMDPGSILGFVPQPEPPAASNYAYSPAPAGPAAAMSIFSRLVGGALLGGGPGSASAASGGTQISLTLQLLNGAATPLPLTLISATTDVPGDFAEVPRSRLGRFSPNPFYVGARAGVIPFHMPAAGRARVELFDAAGRSVKVLFDGHAGEGPQRAHWDGRDGAGHMAPGGLYYCRLSVNGAHYSRKLVAIRR